MSIADHFDAVRDLVRATPFVASTSLSFDERPPTAGLLKGTLTFVDGSQLDVREFFFTGDPVNIRKYAYNYRRGADVVFRYDNARDPAARKLATYPHHRHTSAGIQASQQPTLADVLKEAVRQVSA